MELLLNPQTGDGATDYAIKSPRKPKISKRRRGNEAKLMVVSRKSAQLEA